MTRTIPTLFVLLIAAHAQSPTFDVASVKPSPHDGADKININLGTLNHGIVTLGNTTLSECIRYAYGLVSEDQIEGPDFLRDRELRVDINAKTSPDTPPAQVLLMMQDLLAQRFHLQLHREPRPLRHFELAVAKAGLKMPESPADAQTALKGYGRGRLAYDHIPMRTLTVLLSRQLKQPVLDLTGLTGFYDVHLEWMPDEATIKDAQPSDAPLPDIYRAVQDQLGLLLEPKKTPIDILIVDHADKAPVAN